MAQGALSVGGISREGNLGRSSISKNHSQVGEIPGGAIIQKELPGRNISGEEIKVSLHAADFNSAVNMAKSINTKFGQEIASAIDPVTITVKVPAKFQKTPVIFLAEMENIDFQVASTARVVLNEKTGTVVAGGNVSISEVAVAQGNITVEIKQTENTQLQQAAVPGAITQQSATNVNESIKTQEDKPTVRVLPASSTVADLAKSLNTLGVSPRDIIAIFQAIRKAGALNAELVVM